MAVEIEKTMENAAALADAGAQPPVFQRLQPAGLNGIIAMPKANEMESINRVPAALVWRLSSPKPLIRETCSTDHGGTLHFSPE